MKIAHIIALMAGRWSPMQFVRAESLTQFNCMVDSVREIIHFWFFIIAPTGWLESSLMRVQIRSDSMAVMGQAFHPGVSGRSRLLLAKYSV